MNFLRGQLRAGVRKRLPWLIVLLGLGMLVSVTVGLFEQVVEDMTVIVSFQSLILGMAGNAGTQSLAVTVRLLAGERQEKGKKHIFVFEEACLGLCNGAVLGLMSFVLIGSYLFFLRGEAPCVAFSVSLCIGVALLISLCLAGISGAAIPLLLARLRVDPAVASGPFITTLNDLVAVITYYGLAWILLQKALL